MLDKAGCKNISQNDSKQARVLIFMKWADAEWVKIQKLLC